MSVVIQGTITTQNLNPTTGTPTAGSVVSYSINGGTVTGSTAENTDTIAIQVTGTYTGALTPQTSQDGINWVAIGASALYNVNTEARSATIASAATGIFIVNTGAFNYFRVSANAAVTGTATVTLSTSPATGSVAIGSPLPAGTASIGTVVLGAGSAAVGTIATPSGSALTLTTAATTNATSTKATAGNLFELTVSNPTATAAYVKFYNKASAPTVGTDTPILTIPVPATAAGVGSVYINFGTNGKRFTTGIAFAVTAAAAASDTGVTVAGIQIHGTYV